MQTSAEILIPPKQINNTLIIDLAVKIPVYVKPENVTKLTILSNKEKITDTYFEPIKHVTDIVLSGKFKLATVAKILKVFSKCNYLMINCDITASDPLVESDQELIKQIGTSLPISTLSVINDDANAILVTCAIINNCKIEKLMISLVDLNLLVQLASSVRFIESIFYYNYELGSEVLQIFKDRSLNLETKWMGCSSEIIPSLGTLRWLHIQDGMIPYELRQPILEQLLSGQLKHITINIEQNITFCKLIEAHRDKLVGSVMFTSYVKHFTSPPIISIVRKYRGPFHENVEYFCQLYNLADTKETKMMGPRWDSFMDTMSKVINKYHSARQNSLEIAYMVVHADRAKHKNLLESASLWLTFCKLKTKMAKTKGRFTKVPYYLEFFSGSLEHMSIEKLSAYISGIIRNHKLETDYPVDEMPIDMPHMIYSEEPSPDKSVSSYYHNYILANIDDIMDEPRNVISPETEFKITMDNILKTDMGVKFDAKFEPNIADISNQAQSRIIMNNLELDDQRIKFEAQIRNLEDTIKSLTYLSPENVELQKKKYEIEITNLTKNNVKLSNEHEKLAKRIDKLVEENRKFNSNCDRTKLELEKSAKYNTDLTIENDKLKTENDKLKTKNLTLRTEYERLKASSEKSRTESLANISEMQKQINPIMDRMDNLAQENISMTTTCEKLAVEKIQMIDTLKQLSSNEEKLNLQIETQSEQIKSQFEQIETQSEQIKLQLKQIDDLIKHNEQNEEKKDDFSNLNQITKFNKQISDLKMELHKRKNFDIIFSENKILRQEIQKVLLEKQVAQVGYIGDPIEDAARIRDVNQGKLIELLQIAKLNETPFDPSSNVMLEHLFKEKYNRLSAMYTNILIRRAIKGVLHYKQIIKLFVIGDKMLLNYDKFADGLSHDSMSTYDNMSSVDDILTQNLIMSKFEPYLKLHFEPHDDMTMKNDVHDIYLQISHRLNMFTLNPENSENLSILGKLFELISTHRLN